MKNNVDWNALSVIAWQTRENAYIFGDTKVGAALVAESGKIYSGCNVEHIFRSHDIHAETNAISNMVAAGESKFTRILIVAERARFTPCGGCMDWIFQHGGPECQVAYQTSPGDEIKIFTALELMPYYPY